ncbi:hypothetical protein ACWDX6_24065 [Streptomyces sp. NPDC003027]
MGHHISRSWDGGGHLEASCPCPLAPCGMVDRDAVDPACMQHPPERCKTMRSGHAPADCPGYGAGVVRAIGKTEAAWLTVFDVARSEDNDDGDLYDALNEYRAAVEHEAAERIRDWERGARTLMPLERGAARGSANLIDPEVTT